MAFCDDVFLYLYHSIAEGLPETFIKMEDIMDRRVHSDSDSDGSSVFNFDPSPHKSNSRILFFGGSLRCVFGEGSEANHRH